MSMFIDVMGNDPTILILDFFIQNKEFDYCVSSIAKNTNLSRETVCKYLYFLKKELIIYETRNMGHIKFYGLNITNNSKVFILIKFYEELIKITQKDNERLA